MDIAFFSDIQQKIIANQHSEPHVLIYSTPDGGKVFATEVCNTNRKTVDECIQDHKRRFPDSVYRGEVLECLQHYGMKDRCRNFRQEPKNSY